MICTGAVCAATAHSAASLRLSVSLSSLRHPHNISSSAAPGFCATQSRLCLCHTVTATHLAHLIRGATPPLSYFTFLSLYLLICLLFCLLLVIVLRGQKNQLFVFTQQVQKFIFAIKSCFTPIARPSLDLKLFAHCSHINWVT